MSFEDLSEDVPTMSFQDLSEDVSTMSFQDHSEDVPTMSFQDLSEDVLTMIAEALSEVGEVQDLASLNIALGKTSTAAARWLYREVVLDFSGEEAPHTSAILNVLLRKPEYRPFVQDLIVRMDPSLFEFIGNIQSRYSEYVLKVLPLLPTLQSFSWHALELISEPLMDAIRSIQNLKRFHVDLLHGEFRPLPKFPDLQHHVGKVEQTVRIVSIGSIQSQSWRVIKWPQHVMRSLEGDDQGSLSTSAAPRNAPMSTSRQPPVYRKMWLEGSGLFQGEPAVSPFRDLFPALESLEIQDCEVSGTTAFEIMEGCNWDRLKAFSVVGYPNHGRRDGDGGLSKFLRSFEGLEKLRLYDRGVSDSIAHAHSLAPHASTLKTLEVRREKFEEAYEDLRTTFDDSETYNLPYLQLHYQQLTSLHIDMPAKAVNNKSSSVIKALRRLGNLIHLSLYIPYISSGGDNEPASAEPAPAKPAPAKPAPAKPALTRHGALRLAKSLFTPALQKLDLRNSAPHTVGDPRRMHFSVTRSTQDFRVVDMLALTSTPEEKSLLRLAKSIRAPYWPPAEPGSRHLRLKWYNNLSIIVEKRRVVYEEGKGFTTEGAYNYRIGQLPKRYKVAGQAGGEKMIGTVQHTESEQQHTESEQQHTESEQQHTENEQQYTESEQQHTESKQQHTESEQCKLSLSGAKPKHNISAA